MSTHTVPTPDPEPADAIRVGLIRLDWQPPPEQHARYQETDPEADYYDGDSR